MKKATVFAVLFYAVLLILGCASAAEGDVAINETTFPDADFREVAISFDTDDDGILSAGEISKVTAIDLDPENGDIQSLQGIEYFTELESFSVTMHSGIHGIDFTANTKLKRLELFTSSFINADITGLTGLCDLLAGAEPEKVQMDMPTGYWYYKWENASAAILADRAVFFRTGKEMKKIIAGGTAGDNLTWKLEEDGVLTFSGTGEMGKSSMPSWSQYREKIREIVLEEGVTSISYYAFGNSRNLETVVLPSTLPAIDNYAFSDCVKLKDITIPDQVESIGACAFRRCIALASINLPKRLTTIGDFAFAFCSDLKTLKMPEGTELTEVTRVYEGDLVKLSLPKALKDTGYGTFIATQVGEKIPLAKDFTIPEHTDVIEEEAFAGIGAEYIYFRTDWDKTIQIGKRAFADNPDLKYFELNGEMLEGLQLAEDAFEGCKGLTLIDGYYEEPAFDFDKYCLDHGFTHLINEKYAGDG